MNPFLNLFLDLIFPRACLACGARRTPLCADCFGGLPEAPWHDADPRGVHALFDYRDPAVKKAVWALKYKGDRDIAGMFARALCERITEAFADELASSDGMPEEPLLVPVPVSRRKRRERGFNQMELVLGQMRACVACRTFAAADGILVKTRETKSQTTLQNRKERFGNVKQSFACARPDLVRGKRAVVIDDVWTTGSTIAEAKRALAEAGAQNVTAFAIAH